jgi:hypothetical protein
MPCTSHPPWFIENIKRQKKYRHLEQDLLFGCQAKGSFMRPRCGFHPRSNS